MQDIVEAYHSNGDGEKTSDEAKTEVLNIIFQWPTFGSAFVDVKVKCHIDLWMNILSHPVAEINKYLEFIHRVDYTMRMLQPIGTDDTKNTQK